MSRNLRELIGFLLIWALGPGRSRWVFGMLPQNVLQLEMKSSLFLYDFNRPNVFDVRRCCRTRPVMMSPLETLQEPQNTSGAPKSARQQLSAGQRLICFNIQHSS